MNKILLIEDDFNVSLTLGKILELSGFSVVYAENGSHAIGKLDNSIDLIICDVDMPVMNGLEFVKWFSKTPYKSRVPFIFISGYVQENIVEKIQELGADCILKKPIDSAVLNITIFSLLAQYGKSKLTMTSMI